MSVFAVKNSYIYVMDSLLDLQAVTFYTF